MIDVKQTCCFLCVVSFRSILSGGIRIRLPHNRMEQNFLQSIWIGHRLNHPAKFEFEAIVLAQNQTTNAKARFIWK